MKSKLSARIDHNPVANVQWVPIEKVEANDYNPNAVAAHEMQLLYLSIKEDGYTQPVVTIYDAGRDRYVIIDGFHRYTIMRTRKDIYDLNGGLLPVVVLKKTLNQRMASTVRHNRARGKHSVTGMSSMVFKMLDGGMTDEQICTELGMSTEELLRLKHITGFSKLFKDVKYKRAWETKNQIQLRKGFENGEASHTVHDRPADRKDQAVLSKPERGRKRRSGH